MVPCNPPARLLWRARLAYELGGLRAGLVAAWPVLPLVLGSLGCCGSRPLTFLLGAVLLVSAAFLVASSRELARAVRLGFAAGGLCAALPLALRLLHLCSHGGCRSLLPFCLYGGLLAGSILGYRAARLVAGRGRFLVAAGFIAALAGALGCLTAGLAGVVGMSLGALCATTPFLLVARAR